jgi:hypothetical protein
MWKKNTVVESSTKEPLRLLEDAANLQSVVQIVNFQNMVWQTPTENGTCHQVVCDWEVMREKWLEFDGDPLGEVPEGTTPESRQEELEIVVATLETVHGLRTRRGRGRLEGVGQLEPEQRRCVEAVIRRGLELSYKSRPLMGWFGLLWIGVGFKCAHERGYLTLSVAGLRYKEEMVDENLRGTLINDQMIKSNQMISNQMISNQIINHQRAYNQKADFRELAIRALLYNRQREHTFCQPTGVPYSVACKEEWLHQNVHTHEFEPWEFQCITISMRSLEAYLRYGDGIEVIPIGGGEGVRQTWRLGSADVIVVGLDNNAPDQEVVWDLWLLCHLDYPLNFSVDTHRVRSVNTVQADWFTFVRTASLVRVPSNAKKIIFLTNTVVHQVRIGGVMLDVTTPTRFNELPQTPPQVVDANILVGNCLDRVLGHSEPLTVLFDRAVVGKFSGGVNWLEVNNLVNILMTRFPRQPEAMRIAGENGEITTRSSGAPAQVLQTLFPDTSPAAEAQAWPRFDHVNAVTAFDQCFGDREEVIRHPAVHIGCWNNMAEIGILSGITMYDCTNVEDRSLIAVRIHGSMQDGKERAAYARRAVEEWKRSQQLGDEHLRPDLFPRMARFWEKLIYGSNPNRASLSTLVTMWLGGSTLTWDWDLGRFAHVAPSYTGIRTSPEMWRTELSSSHQHVDLDTTCYRLCVRQGDWKQYTFQQVGKGGDEYRKERDLMKIDILSQCGNFNFLVKPDETRDEEYVFKLYSTRYNFLYFEAGWVKKVISPSNRAWSFGWGVHISQRNWARETFRVLGWTREVESLLQSMHLTVGLWLQPGPADTPLSAATAIHLGMLPFRLDAAQPRTVVKEAGSEDPSILQISEVSRSGIDVVGHSSDVLPTVPTMGGKVPIPAVSRPMGLETGKEVDSIVAQYRPSPEIQPKLGTTAELAAQNIDHRARVDQ